jgi:hypothetical protein
MEQGWKLSYIGHPFAVKTKTQSIAQGFLPLNLPDGVHMIRLKVAGSISVRESYGSYVKFQLFRCSHQYRAVGPILSEGLLDEEHATLSLDADGATYNFSPHVLPVLSDRRQNIVDNSCYFYVLHAEAYGQDNITHLYSISIIYEY